MCEGVDDDHPRSTGHESEVACAVLVKRDDPHSICQF